MNKGLLIGIALLGATHCIFAQEQLGIRLDHYNGINAALLNPAGHAATPFSWDVNLLEGAFFVSNNYTYTTPMKLSDWLSDPDQLDIALGPDITPEKPLPPGARKVDFYTPDRSLYAKAQVSVMGPSFYVRLGQNHTIGLLTRFRVAGNVDNVDHNLAYYPYYNRDFFRDFRVSKFNAGAMAWSEIGLNYAYRLPVSNGSLSLGFTAKYLQGYEAAYFNNKTDFQLSKQPGDTLSGGPIHFEFGYTNSNFTGDEYALQRNGSGLGFDLGVMYVSGEEDGNFTWRWGVALLDIGRVNFTANARQHVAQTEAVSIVGADAFESFNRRDEFEEAIIQVFSEQVLQDSNASLQSNEFAMRLPTAISLQAERALMPNVYLGAALIQGLPTRNAAVQRGSLLAITPRYTHRWFGASLPVSLYQWQRLQLGLALRLGFITIGSEHLGSLFRRSEFYGADFYFAIKVNPFKIGEKQAKPSRRSAAPRRRGGGGSNVKCYEF